MLLEALVACAGISLKAAATVLDIPVKSATVSAEGDVDLAARSAWRRKCRSDLRKSVYASMSRRDCVEGRTRPVADESPSSIA